MAKFKDGEFALITGAKANNSESKKLLRYENTVVEIVQFEGNIVAKGNEYMNEGDWYLVQGEDMHEFYVREKVLKKLPNEYGLAMKEVEKIYQQPRGKSAAKVSN